MATTVQITPNWMSSVDSPSYKLTLYLVHPSVWNNPNTLTASDVPRDSQGQPLAIIIAESGATSTYTIDNLSIQSFVTPGSSSGNTTSGVFQFNLYEVLGFKLLNRILAYSKPYNFITLQSAKYVLKVEFQGLDPETKQAVKYGGTFCYSLVFKQIQSSINEGGTQHNIIAHNSPKTAIGLSTVKTDVVVKGASTVGQYLNLLEKALNQSEIDYRKTPELKDPVSKHTWKITLDTNATTQVGKSIPNNGSGQYGSINVTETFDLGSKPIAGTANADQAGGQNRNIEDSSTIDAHINSETNLISYLRTFLTKNTPALGELNKLERTDGVKRTVISVTPKITFGSGTDDYTDTSEMEIELVVGLDITYSIPQNDPKAQKEKQNDRSFQRRLFGELPITKKYHYLYTGRNTELLQFDLNIENAFFMARDPAAGLNYAEIKQTHVPTNPTPIGVPTSRSGSGAYATSLSDVDGSTAGMMERVAYAYAVASPESQQVNETKGPGAVDTIDSLADLEFRSRSTDFIEASFKIKGDPFWMGTPGVYTNDAVVSAANYLNTDSVILFINHLPDEAMTDPTVSTSGELDIAASGVYEVRTIETSLSQGRFEQTLKTLRNRNISTFMLINEMETR